MSKHLPELIRIAKQDMPSMRHDVGNAVNPLAQRPVIQKMFDILEILLHHTIHESVDRVMASQAASSAPVAVPVTAPVAVPIVQRAPRQAQPIDPLGLPPLSSTSQPPQAPPLTAVPDAPIQPGMTNVFVTSQGTKVISPTGAQTILPPGEAVTQELTSGVPELPPPPEGGVNIVLPPGGAGLSPELSAALAGRPSSGT